MSPSLSPLGSHEWLYGRHAVLEALRGRRRHVQLLIAEGTERHGRIQEIITEATARGVAVQLVPRQQLTQLVGSVNHQGVLLETSRYPYVRLDMLIRQAQGRPILVLDHLQDPQNLATLLRTADAVAAAGVIIPERRAAGITPAVVNASAGAVEHLSIAQVVNLGRSLSQLREVGYWVVALEPGPTAHNLFLVDIPTPTALLIGSEGKGLAPTLLRQADLQVALPMRGHISSLNAAVAGSIALYELLRRELETTPADNSIRR